MTRFTPLHFYPERIVWIGLALMGVGSCVSLPFIYSMKSGEAACFSYQKTPITQKFSPLPDFSLGLKNEIQRIPLPEMKSKMSFSFDPPRPDLKTDGKRLMVRLNQTSQAKRVYLPCRLDLEFEGEQLVFSEDPSPLWMDLATQKGKLKAEVFLQGEDGDVSLMETFLIEAGESPIQGAHEFKAGSPFRVLAESRWWGKDQFRLEESGERLEIGATDFVEMRVGDWLVHRDGKWLKAEAPDPKGPIAHIQSISPKEIVLEGWDRDQHVRLGIGLGAGIPLKLKAEDLFSSVRIRSEKQISCMIDKQCMVLKVSDWVLKSGPRWKILRRKDEKEAFLHGKLFGELFVLDQIVQKQGQKMIQGRLFNSGRTQMLKFELAAKGNRKSPDKSTRKGRLK